MSKKLLSVCAYGNALIAIFLALIFFIVPFGMLIKTLGEPGLSNGEISPFLFRWHHQLSGRFEPWASERIESSQASELGLYDISGTEWPIFSAVYYLWTTEALQDAWQEDPSLYPSMPKEYAEGAIEAAAAIVSDPNHATWVKKHWGDEYLHEENIFYRMLLISGLTSFQKLLDDDKYEWLLIDQVESLSNELDESPYGLLDDYPGQCYPIDILPAIAAIQRADELLGTDHSKFISRTVRAFEDERLDEHTGLPAYVANSKTGIGFGPARGVGISYMLIWAPELWPIVAQSWFTRYEDHFWQEGQMISGVREFSKDIPVGGLLFDVDAGPVVAGNGTAASAFGIGAARANGRFDLAYPLSAEALVAAWPLYNGTLLGARALSNLSDAPYIGESALLFNLSRQPIASEQIVEKSGLPTIVYLGLLIYLGIGLVGIGFALWLIKRWQKNLPAAYFPMPRFQLIVWLSLVIAAVLALMFYQPIIGILLLFSAQLLPRSKKFGSRN